MAEDDDFLGLLETNDSISNQPRNRMFIIENELSKKKLELQISNENFLENYEKFVTYGKIMERLQFFLKNKRKKMDILEKNIIKLEQEKSENLSIYFKDKQIEKIKSDLGDEIKFVVGLMTEDERNSYIEDMRLRFEDRPNTISKSKLDINSLLNHGMISVESYDKFLNNKIVQNFEDKELETRTHNSIPCPVLNETNITNFLTIKLSVSVHNRFNYEVNRSRGNITSYTNNNVSSNTNNNTNNNTNKKKETNTKKKLRNKY